MAMEDQELKDPEMAEAEMQVIRSRATELLLREEWNDAVYTYSQFITLCRNQTAATDHHLPKLQKSLCLALCNRAEARSKLRNFEEALKDCDEALKIECTHFKTLLCKGKILLNLNRYSSALECFKTALVDPQVSGSSENLNGYLEKCKMFQHLSKTGAFDLSDWILNGFSGKPPELAEFIGPVQIRRSGISGRGLFATKNVDSGTLLLVTKAIAIERGILPENCDENAQLVMWKNFVDKVTDSATKSTKTKNLIGLLSTGEAEDDLDVPEMSVFKPETEDQIRSTEMSKILSVLDINALVEDAASAKVLGKNSDYYGVGLWVLASFINHSCSPNARRLHIGDHIMVHAARDIKTGEEITFSYFDPLSPWKDRKRMSETWGFNCKCKRCRFEEQMSKKEEIKEIEMGGGSERGRGIETGAAIYKLEEGMRRWMVRGKEKGYLRASFWESYFEVFSSEKAMKKWGRRIQGMEMVVESVVDAVGSDERVVKTMVERFKRNGNGGGALEMERVLKLGRGVYGKVMKKQALRSLLELVGSHEYAY
ncbi:uncharacterized protein LOC111491461 [Cucurbita maxima]|uniref:Uncharacterized protein LOC111491461 n=1 Tax=Cucurbita maxima TaxID=3661 RepID=A0A6J1K403_CUCMA|nr:uncharacterized protein LOC111491461 [Cucurbita maxima]XP_022996270.1 uncharacterized protein LOC111491461 [Cucurbita maxima]